jgi:tetratricopeptide (TPR) repeat protein
MRMLKSPFLTVFILFFSCGLAASAFAQPASSPCFACPGSQPRWASSGQVSGTNQADQSPEDLPPEAYSLFKMAQKDWKAKRWEEAVEKYKFIIKNYPSTPLAARSHMMVGLYLKYKSKWDQAIDEFNKGISIIPGTREAQDAKTSIACIHASRGNFDEALRLIREVFAESRDWDQVRYCSLWLKKLNRLKNAKDKGELRSCGPKALAFVLRNKGIETSEKDIAKLLLTQSYQVSLEDLRKASDEKGVKASGVSVTLDQLNTMELPIIALINPGHYIVILSADDKSFKMIEPENGERTFTIYKEALEQVWTGYVLAFSEKDILAEKHFLLLTQAEMESIRGGTCPCCPTGGRGEQGGPDDNPDTIFDTVEQTIKGCNSSNSKGMPRLLVNTTYLTFVLEDIDLSYSGLGPKVEIKRTYNSSTLWEGVFGRGWTFSYKMMTQIGS